MDSWKEITGDQKILSLVQECEIKFKSMPIQSNPPRPFNMSKEEEILVDLEVQNLLKGKGAIKICSPDPNQFISNIFTIPKKDGGEASGSHVRTESVCRLSSIQDGGYITSERYCLERRLHDKAGSSRCLLDYSSRSKIKDLFKIFLEGHALSVHMSTIWPLTISRVVHQDTKHDDINPG